MTAIIVFSCYSIMCLLLLNVLLKPFITDKTMNHRLNTTVLIFTCVITLWLDTSIVIPTYIFVLLGGYSFILSLILVEVFITRKKV